MAELSTAARDHLTNHDFAYIDGKGERHLPIHDEAHVRSALARFNQTSFDNADAKRKAAQSIQAAAHEHGIEIDPDDEVVKAAR